MSVSLLLEYICYNIKLNITLNFRFHMYDKKCISVTSQAVRLSTPPPVTNCHTFSDPSPSSVTYFMDGPICSIDNKIVNVSVQL